jgi:branched-chain amino acid transport system substrate-binding protein
MSTVCARKALTLSQAMAAQVAVAVCCLAATIGAARADAVIGVAVPMLGLKANYGATLVAAAQAEAARMTALGVHGAVGLAIEDDQCSSAGGAAAAARLVALKVAIVIGHPCSNAALSAAAVYARAGVAFVAIGARHPDLTAKRAGPSVFRLGGRDDAQAAETARFIQDFSPGGHTAIIHDRTVYARGLANSVAANLRKNLGAGVSVYTIVAGEKDYGAVVAQILATRPATVYFAGFPIEGAIVLRQLRAAGSTARFIGCDALNDPAFLATAGTLASSVDVVTSALEPDGQHLVESALQAFQKGLSQFPLSPATGLGVSLKADVLGNGAGASFRLRPLNQAFEVPPSAPLAAPDKR